MKQEKKNCSNSRSLISCTIKSRHTAKVVEMDIGYKMSETGYLFISSYMYTLHQVLEMS